MASIQQWVREMPVKDNPFYRELGRRIAQYRRTADLTQVQLAERLGVSQQTMAHYENGYLRISVELIRQLSKELSIPVEELIDAPKVEKRKKRGPASVLERQVEKIGTMPRTKQKFISEMLDALIQQQSATR